MALNIAALADGLATESAGYAELIDRAVNEKRYLKSELTTLRGQRTRHSEIGSPLCA